MIVYIKTFNRPFYLERCLTSLTLFAQGVSKIVVLDDGTIPIFLDRIRTLFPQIEIRQSSGQHGKWALVQAKRFEAIANRFGSPHTFWLREIRADKPDYFCLLEDDTWLTRSVDFHTLKTSMRESCLSICRLFWGSVPDGLSQRTVTVRSMGPRDSLLVQTAKPTRLDDIWGFFLVCMSVYERTFYEKAHTGVNDYLNETAILQNIWRELEQSVEPRFLGRLNKRVCCQGWAIPGRSDIKYYAMGVEQHIFVDLLNKLWMHGDFDSLRNFPADFEINWLCSIFVKHLPISAVQAYQNWRTNDPGARSFPGLVPPTRLGNL